MRPSRAPDSIRRRIAILYHSAAGGTRLVAELLSELLSREHDARATSIYDAGAVDAAGSSDVIVLCYPTYFLRPSRSMKDFIDRLAPLDRPHSTYLVTTYELYTENSLRECALLVKDKGMIVSGSACIRAPGSDLTCVLPEWLCPWLFRFERGLAEKLRSITDEIQQLARSGGPERLPRLKWYTPFAQALQRGVLDGFFEWRTRIHVIADRCSDCGACISQCFRGAWERDGLLIRHDPRRCELCTRCIHHCPGKAIVLSDRLRDNRRLDARHYARLKAEASAGRDAV